MGYSVVIEERAQREITEASAWIAQHSSERAVIWHFDIENAIFSLENNLFRCPIAPESYSFPEEIRHLIFEQYRILFTVRDETVHVLRVRHGHRDYAKPDEE